MFGHKDKGYNAEIASILVKVKVFDEDLVYVGIIEYRYEAHHS